MYKCLVKIDCQSVVFTNSKWEKECVLLSAQGEVHTCLLPLSTSIGWKKRAMEWTEPRTLGVFITNTNQTSLWFSEPQSYPQLSSLIKHSRLWTQGLDRLSSFRCTKRHFLFLNSFRSAVAKSQSWGSQEPSKSQHEVLLGVHCNFQNSLTAPSPTPIPPLIWNLFYFLHHDVIPREWSAIQQL